MDVSALGAAYLDEYRLSGPAAGLTRAVSRNENAADGAQNFAEILKNTVSINDVSSGEAAASPAKKKVTIDKTDKLYEQCLELETFLVKTLISSMRSTVQKSSLVDEGFAGKMYEDMLYDEYAKDFAKNANFGLAEQAYLELTGQRGRVIIR